MNAFKFLSVLIAFVVAASPSFNASASAQGARDGQGVIGVLRFTLNKREAAKGEPVVVTYQLSRPAQDVRITATNREWHLLGIPFPQTIAVNQQRTAGVITFTIPPEVGTLNPLLIQLSVDGNLRGLWPLRVTCDYAWFFQPATAGCPFEPPRPTEAAIQRFERGTMIWLQATDSVYVLYGMADGYTGGTEFALDRFDDAFVEGMQESDPAYIPPPGKRQPVRGFGLIWRTQDRVRTLLGWALEQERGFSTCFAQTFGGWRSIHAYFTTPESKLLELSTYYSPTQWREVSRIDGQAVKVKAKIDGC